MRNSISVLFLAVTVTAFADDQQARSISEDPPSARPSAGHVFTPAEGIQCLDKLVTDPKNREMYKASLVYGSTNNKIGGKNWYAEKKGPSEICAHQECAHYMNIAANNLIQYNKNHGKKLHFVVFDAVRPCWIQQDMWKWAKQQFPTEEEAKLHVSDPKNCDNADGKISKHVLGTAFDIGLADENGKLVDMGTEHDELTGKSATTAANEQALDPQVRDNRHVLRDIMQNAGFNKIWSQWWYFSCPMKAGQKYSLQN